MWGPLPFFLGGREWAGVCAAADTASALLVNRGKQQRLSVNRPTIDTLCFAAEVWLLLLLTYLLSRRPMHPRSKPVLGYACFLGREDTYPLICFFFLN